MKLLALSVLCLALGVQAVRAQDDFFPARIHERQEDHTALTFATGSAEAEVKGITGVTGVTGATGAAGTIILHPEDGTGYNATGSYTGKNLPVEAAPSELCCHICPSSCPAGSTGSGCFRKCYRVCGAACRIEPEHEECELGVNCGMTESSGCPVAAETAVTAATGVEETKPALIVAPEPEPAATAAPAPAPVVAATAMPEITGIASEPVEPEIISEEDIADADAADLKEAAEATVPSANDPRDPDYVNNPASDRDLDRVVDSQPHTVDMQARRDRIAKEIQDVLDATAEVRFLRH